MHFNAHRQICQKLLEFGLEHRRLFVAIPVLAFLHELYSKVQLQTTLRERHAYYAGLISGAVNDLYELKRSRLIRLGSRLNANAGKKIDTTIEKMSS